MPPLLARRGAWVLCMGLATAAWAGAEPPALCDARTLGQEARLQYDAGLAALKRKEAGRAVPPLSRALELEPRAAVVRLVLGTALATTGRTAAAAREYTAFVSACPEHPRATDILRLLGDYRRAREQSASAAEASEPVTLTAPTGKARAGGTALCDGQQLQGAARARYATGERYLKRARYAEAAGALERALEAEPRAAAAQLLLGTSYARLGQVDAGARAYESFLDACPEHPKAPTVRRLLADFRGVR